MRMNLTEERNEDKISLIIVLLIILFFGAFMIHAIYI